MNDMRDVAVLVGSLRAASLNRKMAHAMAELAPASLSLEIVEIGTLPPYNEDDDTQDPPAPWVALRQRLQAADAVLFVTPEYNRSVPGALKNAIDVASRPSGKSALAGKPAAVMTVSRGAIGGFGANHHLRQMLVFLDMPAMQQPEAYIGNAAKLFDAHGHLASHDTREFVRKFVEAFASWIERVGPARSRADRKPA
jgi:chromate reductase